MLLIIIWWGKWYVVFSGIWNSKIIALELLAAILIWCSTWDYSHLDKGTERQRTGSQWCLFICLSKFEWDYQLSCNERFISGWLPAMYPFNLMCLLCFLASGDPVTCLIFFCQCLTIPESNNQLTWFFSAFLLVIVQVGPWAPSYPLLCCSW